MWCSGRARGETPRSAPGHVRIAPETGEYRFDCVLSRIGCVIATMAEETTDMVRCPELVAASRAGQCPATSDSTRSCHGPVLDRPFDAVTAGSPRAALGQAQREPVARYGVSVSHLERDNEFPPGSRAHPRHTARLPGGEWARCARNRHGNVRSMFSLAVTSCRDWPDPGVEPPTDGDRPPRWGAAKPGAALRERAAIPDALAASVRTARRDPARFAPNVA